MTADLHSGRVVWVTGAASGIGRATAETIVAEGGSVVADDLPGAEWSWVASDCIAVHEGDVTSDESNDEAVALARERFGGIHGAVLNAGIAAGGDLVDGELDGFDRAMDVNVRGVLLGVRAAARAMEAGSAITVTASISGLRADPGMWAYNASKGAVVNLVRAASLELARRGIRINAVCPGPVETGMTAALGAAGRDAIAKHIPLQRWGAPEEIAAAHSFLVSPRASFITGTTLCVDGGVDANNGQFPPAPFDA